MNYESIKSFADIFSMMEDEFSERIAFRWVDDKENVCEKSYHDFCIDIKRGITYLKRILGKTVGTHMAILAKNSYDYAVMLYSGILSGAVLIPLNVRKSPDEISYELDLADVSIILHDGEYIEGNPDFTECFQGEFYEINGYQSCCPGSLCDESNEDELCMILFTSGTTGKSKGVMLGSRAIISVIKDDLVLSAEAQQKMGTRISENLMVPLYHVAGISRVFLRTGTGNIINFSEPRSFYRDVDIFRPNYIFAVPVILKSIHKDVVSGRKSRLGELKTIGCVGAVLNDSMKIDLINNGYVVKNAYGMTELFSGGTRNSSQDERHFSSIGKPNSIYQCKIIDGELCFKGKGMMTGYYKNPEQTAEVIDSNGWLHTGDLAEIDDDGYVYLTGRKKNLIILDSGENVSPEELEQILLRNEAVIEVIVKEKDNKICAEIFCEKDKTGFIRSFIVETNKTLPLYKQIGLIEFRNEPFERTSNGKIKR